MQSSQDFISVFLLDFDFGFGDSGLLSLFNRLMSSTTLCHGCI